ncbi:DNA-binding protein [Legionella qingyii]|uniref:DNA-binding protein n=1 Tax=Legionella qingyii TaxID=2184757 RepID=A0A317TZM8_9GAMM|nr:helix-turn-helix domain-containing protein [Legionella qingyii]PWY53896.1 DNA-binding protein [Legionella qingyii]RUR24166.1 DNA-binding protein [Legionella qingyii]
MNQNNLLYKNINSNNTLNIIEAALFLGAHKETVRRMAVSGDIPGVKIGRGWVFLEEDLVVYIRSKYATSVTSQGAVHRSNNKWRFTKETQLGGLVSPIKEKEYKEALGLPIK